MADQVTAADGERLTGGTPPPDPARSRGRWRRWWLFTAAALGLLLCIQPLFSGDGGSSPLSWHPDTRPDGRWSMGPADPAVGSAPPSARPTAPAPTSAAATRPAPTGGASTSPSPVPALLGPSDKAGVEDLVEAYCDQHVDGATAVPRLDGRWQCTRLLVFGRIVDLDVACVDAYGKGVYAQSEDRHDAYAWRCYRR
ncbi:hypothetical protein [Catellatospora sp. NPDC049609]|uniref:hypothetical protein n=1 Tax=Catellatospora sp. NPDC049609 TaxID=3155505 RepID=UPI003435C922